MTYTSLLDELLASLEHAGDGWFRANARAFLTVCDLFGRYASQHHDRLVKRFIENPAATIPPNARPGLTASGPPLSALLRSLEVLRDMRMAAPRADLPSRHDDLRRLRDALK